VSVSDISRFGESMISRNIFTPGLTLIDLGTRHSIGLAIQVYPLYENGFRAHRGQSIQDNNKESAELYAEFAKVAEKNPLSWNYGKPAATEGVIGTVSKKNRMICFPCKSSPGSKAHTNSGRSAFNECLQQYQPGWRVSSDFK